ncbi:MAG: hypothetical protein VX740_08770 [Pseudomonadota bacterium]|nr:hypothetical protein [Pseudomonadota bacterium]
MTYINSTTANRLPSNMTLCGNSDFLSQIHNAERLIKAAPINLAVCNYFADSADYNNLREYLQSLVNAKKLLSITTNPCRTRDDYNEELQYYFQRLAKKTPNKLRNAALEEQYKEMLTTMGNGFLDLTQNHSLTLEIRADTTQRAHYIHIDGADINRTERYKDTAFHGQAAKAICNLSQYGTAFFANDDVHTIKNASVMDDYKNNTIKQYRYLMRDSVPSNVKAWDGGALSLSIFPCAAWPHIPLCHSAPIHSVSI